MQLTQRAHTAWDAEGLGKGSSPKEGAAYSTTAMVGMLSETREPFAIRVAHLGSHHFPPQYLLGEILWRL